MQPTRTDYLTWLEKIDEIKLTYGNEQILASFTDDINAAIRAGAVETALLNVVQRRLKWSDQADFYANMSKPQYDDAIQFRLLARRADILQSNIQKKFGLRVE